MLSINISELIWTIINFFLLYVLLKRFLFDPVGRLLDERQAKIDAGLDAEKQAQAAVDENRARLEAEKTASRREASTIIGQTEADDEKRRAESIEAAKEEARASLETGAARLQEQDELDEALLREQSAALSALLTDSLLKRED